MSLENGENPLFEEVQKFTQIWIWVLIVFCLVAALAPLAALPFMVGEGAFAGRAITIGCALLMVGVALMIAFARLRVRVYSAGLDVHFRPFLHRKILFSELKGFQAVTYSPIGEYGGWGVRGFGKNKAYNVSGNRGVRLLFNDERRLLLGSQRAEELEAIIAEAWGRDPGLG